MYDTDDDTPEPAPSDGRRGSRADERSRGSGRARATGGRRVLRTVVRMVGAVAVALLVVIAVGGWSMYRCYRSGLRAEQTAGPERAVTDVTKLVRIDVDQVARPRTTAEVQELVRRHQGPISIGGGRFSQGGQVATDGTLFLDMREMDDLLAMDLEARTIRVEAGITWRKIQEAIDPHGLALKIMQSYANFTVGGSLSVNAHGRYVNEGPLVHSVRSIELVLADGSVLRASRDQNSEVFWGAVGGYGGLGVITEVELDVVPNEPVERSVERMPASAFNGWFDAHIRGSSGAVFFNGDLYPPAFDEVAAITYNRTDRQPTIPEHLQPQGGSTATERFTYWWVSEAPLGKQARSEVIDRMRLTGKPVVWRNYEASYDVYGLEPGSRENSTYVLQEYFVPVERFDAFVPKMAEIFTRYHANVVNVSIRHAKADPDTLLTWAPVEVFAFVVYYKQGTSDAERTEVGVWTRELIDAVASEGGTYYLPYQILATDEQFHRAYPRAEQWFQLKMRLDPEYRLRNSLWDRYLLPYGAQARATQDGVIARELAQRDGYLRPEDQTYLTLPEWYIVYSGDELGAHLSKGGAPSAFPFYASVCQFCRLYGAVTAATRGRYPPNRGYHAMIWVIGASYAAEYAVKGAYEATIGRLSEAIGGVRSGPDQAYAAVATDYGAFMHHTPWYAFPFSEARYAVTSAPSGWSLRGLERKAALGGELTVKGWWGAAMGGASHSAYGVETEVISAWVRCEGVDLASIPGVLSVEDLGGNDHLVSLQRYEPFTAAVLALVDRGVEILEVAGGHRVVVQVTAPADATDAVALWGDVLFAWPILTEPGRQRIALDVPVRRLDEVLPALREGPVQVEHLYDF